MDNTAPKQDATLTIPEGLYSYKPQVSMSILYTFVASSMSRPVVTSVTSVTQTILQLGSGAVINLAGH
jgi:hypothetical protein